MLVALRLQPETVLSTSTSRRSSPKRRWAAADDEHLRERYGRGIPVARIVAELGRSVSAVQTRVGVIGLASRSKPWSPGDDVRLCELRMNGVAPSGVAAELKRTINAVTAREAVLRQRDPAAMADPGRRTVTAWSSEDDRILVARYAEGWTLERIAAELDRPLHVVVDRIERARKLHAGALPLRRPRWTDDERTRLARRYSEGASYRQLGLEFGRAKGSISRQLSTLRRLGYLDESHGA